MLDDILEGLLEAWLAGKGTSKRTQLVFRVLFGLLGVGLSAVGFYHMIDYDAGLHFRAAAAAVFVFMGCFSLFNVTLLLPWKWPGRGFVLSFVLVFVARIALGP